MIAKLVAAAAISGMVLLASPMAQATPACAGTVSADGTCHIHDTTAGYRIDIAYPTGYPDQGELATFVTQQRDTFVAWAAETGPASTKELDILPHTYRSRTTESVVLTIGTNTGVRPVTTFRSFTHDVHRGTSITIDNLFAAGAQPLTVLNPIVQRELSSRDIVPTELTMDDYRTFAITDDTVTFFFPQGELLPHSDGPLRIEIPRTELPSLNV
jgi:hypothetical protein